MSAQQPPTAPARTPGRIALTVVAWLWVAIPFGYGLVQLVAKIPALFSP